MALIPREKKKKKIFITFDPFMVEYGKNFIFLFLLYDSCRG
jgi:hypothetical protein